MKQDLFVSTVAVLPDAAPWAERFIREAQEAMARHFADYELVLIDNASNGGRAGEMDRLLDEVPRIRYLRLASPVAEETAMAAGLENAIGDFIVLLDPAVDPCDMIVTGVMKAREKGEVVIGVSLDRRPLWRRLTGKAFRFLFARLLHYRIPERATAFRALSRQALNAVLATGRFHHGLFFRISRAGYPSVELPYHGAPRDGGSGRERFSRLVRRSLKMIVFNSTLPLRYLSLAGLAGSLFAFLVAIYALAVNLIKQDVVEGWTTTNLFLSLQFFLVFLILSFFGEYLARLLDERGDRQSYSVAVDKSSPRMVARERLNVFHRSAPEEPGEDRSGVAPPEEEGAP